MKGRQLRPASTLGLLAPLAATAIAAMTVFVLSLVLWAHEVDESARAHEQNLVLQGLLSRINEVELGLRSHVDSAEAVRELSSGDTAWIEAELARDLGRFAPFDEVMVLDRADRVLFPASGASVASLGAEALVAEVRRAETLNRGRSREPVERSAFVADGRRARLISAALVQPATGTGRGTVVIASQTVAEPMLDLLRSRYQLPPIAIAVGAAGPDARTSSVTFDTNRPDSPLVLSWVRARPGTELLHRAMWPVVTVLVAFGAVGGLMLARTRRAARALVASNRAQTEFLANMSHEIRTPLNGVVAVADALAMTELSGRQEELVEIIRASGATLERLLSDVLDLARIETGAVAIEPEPFRLAEAVRGAVALHRPKAVDKGLALVVDCPPEADTVVVGDAVRLKQILTNLISNAIKFTEAGQVSVQVERQDQERWAFVVQDTGVGFDPSFRDRLFTRFQQADGSVTRRYGGSGLGLAICRQLAELMGGAIEAESRPGAGARFRVSLPLAPAEIAAAAPAALEPEPVGADAPPLRVLIADDHPVNRRVVELLLEPTGAVLVSTQNGREACEAFEADAFDCVLMDMQMPVMDGLSATRRIRAFEARSRRAPAYIVMLTANALREHQEASLAAGADAHLAKPIEARRLYDALAAAAEQLARRPAA